jgi:hypothetical protein
VVLDVQLGYETTWKWLGELKSNPRTVGAAGSCRHQRRGPAQEPRPRRRCLSRQAGLEAGADRALNELTRARVLIIDDDPASRYTIRKCFQDQPYQILEAANAREACARRPPCGRS